MSYAYSDVFLVAFFFFFNDTATTEIYTLSLHDALPISRRGRRRGPRRLGLGLGWEEPGGELPHGSAVEAGGRGVDGGRHRWRHDGREARQPAQVVFDRQPRVVGGATGFAARRRRGQTHLTRGHLAVALVGVVLGLHEDVAHPRDPHAVGAVARAVELRRIRAVGFLEVSVRERQKQVPPTGGIRHPPAVRRDDAAAFGVPQVVDRHVLELVRVAVDARGTQEELPRHDLVDHLLLERQEIGRAHV